MDAPALTTREAAFRRWVVQVVHDPNGTNATQVDALHAAGFSEREIFEATVYVAFCCCVPGIHRALGSDMC
jgi:alkylhydroperoxidase family enzyme